MGCEQIMEKKTKLRLLVTAMIPAGLLLSPLSYAAHGHHAYVAKHMPAMKIAPAVKPSKLDKNFPSILDALKNGQAKLLFKARYEGARITGFDNAHANTLLSRITYQSAKWHQLSAYLQLYNVSIIGRQRYNSGGGTSNDLINNASIPDPANAGFSQAYLQYKGLQQTDIKIGRQIIAINNQRMVGTSMFRQTLPTFDAISIKNKSIPHTSIFYAHAFRYHSVFGTQSPVGSIQSADNFVNIKFSGLKYVDITPYGFWTHNFLIARNSTRIIGLRLTGETALNAKTKVMYSAEFANQHNDANNNTDYSAWYRKFLLGASWSGLTAKVYQEGFKGNNSNANEQFIVPLGGNHGKNGWADVFTNIPNAGLYDTAVSVGAKIRKFYNVSTYVGYHNFRSEDGGFHYGNEWDVNIAKNFGEHYAAKLEYANFKADDTYPGIATTKRLWLTLIAKIDVL